MTYSQEREDLIILQHAERCAERNRFAMPGRVLEIGAWDPFKLSNSRLLIENGWEALLCEFSPHSVRNLLLEYGTSERVGVLAAAITVSDAAMRRYEITDDALSTIRPEERWRDTGGFYGKLWVPQIPLAVLFGQFNGAWDVISIDTEGTSVDLAMSILRDHQVHPSVMCVEHNGRSVELMQPAQEIGYHQVHANGNNVILALYD